MDSIVGLSFETATKQLLDVEYSMVVAIAHAKDFAEGWEEVPDKLELVNFEDAVAQYHCAEQVIDCLPNYLSWVKKWHEKEIAIQFDSDSDCQVNAENFCIEREKRAVDAECKCWIMRADWLG